ncbi:MAG: peptidoglycan DD-metalloendopeptidase family protein [Caldilineaceae bacterium]|nr:peptidoglycan DD-metalloendopeptidase family protein [Caldilineaceae bacterium]
MVMLPWRMRQFIASRVLLSPRRPSPRGRVRILAGLALGLSLMLLFTSAPTYAQGEVGSYTVQSGDTLFTIAQRFGVTVEILATLNQLADPSLIAVGQVLLIPGAPSLAVPGAVGQTQALPGDTLATIAARYALAPEPLTLLNGMSVTTRLFPGQPLFLPVVQPAPQLHFGAVQEITVPDALVQGRTGQLSIRTRRPLSVTATWNDVPLVFTQSLTDSLQQTAFLPVHALQAPAPYTLTLTYIAANGLSLTHRQWLTVVPGDYLSQVIALADEKGGLLAPEVSEAEFTKVNALWTQASPTLWWTGVFTRPIGIQYATTSPFGTRRNYTGGAYATTSYHAGQDFGAPEGVPILAPAAGVVVLAEPLQVRGNAVIIDHGRGIFTGYWHMSEIKVTPGQWVSPGDGLGLVGTTGLSTGAHLHWELRIYGIAVDPMQFLLP